MNNTTHYNNIGLETDFKWPFQEATPEAKSTKTTSIDDHYWSGYCNALNKQHRSPLGIGILLGLITTGVILPLCILLSSGAAYRIYKKVINRLQNN